MADLIQNFNTASEMSWNECLAVTPNHCGKAVISGYFDRTTKYVNGLPTYYTLKVLRYSITSAGSNVVDDSYYYYSAAVHHSCPPRYGAVTSGLPDNQTMHCRYVEPSSCPKTGNPINIGTGTKEETEIDFQTQDGILKIERRYVDQYKGWSLDKPASISYIEPNANTTRAVENAKEAVKNACKKECPK